MEKNVRQIYSIGRFPPIPGQLNESNMVLEKTSICVVYYFATEGPTLIPLIAPDLVAPGVDVGSYYPEGYGTMSGTSVAAAVTACVCALFLQWGIVDGNEILLSTNTIKAYLIRGCTRSSNDTYPNYKWGYRSLNLLQSFQILRGMY